MKKLLSMVVLTTSVLFAHAQDNASQSLPNTVVKDVKNGKKLPFNKIVTPGRVTVVSFWATWCVPCKKEIKNISKALPSWKEKADFDYVTVSIDEARAEGIMNTYAVSQGWEFPYYLDANSDLKRSLNFQSVPFTLIVDKEGKITWRHIGYEEGGENEILAKLEELSPKK